jgi:hypothetical protein
MTVACASASAQQAEETKPIGNNAELPTVDVVANQSGQSQEETEQKNGSLTVLSVAKQRQQLGETVQPSSMRRPPFGAPAGLVR